MRWLQGGPPAGKSGMRWDWMRRTHPQAAHVLDLMAQDRSIADIDYARVLAAVDQAAANRAVADRLSRELVAAGPGAAVHPSGLRTLPGTPLARHDLLSGQVRLGEIVATDGSKSPGTAHLDLDVLSTSTLVVGPVGSGKTRGVALPVVEHLSLVALTHRASVVVIDPRGEYDRDGWFDVTIDPLNPTHGISPYGATSPDIAADRLASVVLGGSDADADAASNALYGCLAPYVEAFGAWPSLRELLGLLRAESAALNRVQQRLDGPDANESRDLLDARRAQAQGSHDPAAALVERLARLDRPAFRRIFDSDRTFDMGEINGPVRVRVVLPEAEYPEVSRILARLVAQQFVQAATAGNANPGVFKALVLDDAAQYVDHRVVRSLQRLRAANAGLLLTTQSLSELAPDARAVVRAAGNQIVFGGLDVAEAEAFAQASDEGADPPPRDDTEDDEPKERVKVVGPFGVRPRKLVERASNRPARWTAADVAGVPRGHCLLTTTRSNGFRSGPVLVKLRDD